MLKLSIEKNTLTLLNNEIRDDTRVTSAYFSVFNYASRPSGMSIRYKFSSKEHKVANESRLVKVRQTSIVTMHHYRNLLRLRNVEDYHISREPCFVIFFLFFVKSFIIQRTSQIEHNSGENTENTKSVSRNALTKR